jgi:hypothetical protein
MRVAVRWRLRRSTARDAHRSLQIGNACEKRPQPGVRARSSRGASAQIGNKSSGTSSTPTMAYSRSTQTRPTRRSCANSRADEVAERVGFVHLRAFGAPAHLIVSSSHPPESRVRSRAGEGGWRREWDSDSRAPLRFCNLQNPLCRECQERPRCRRSLHAIARQQSFPASSFLDIPEWHILMYTAQFQGGIRSCSDEPKCS